jgi:ribA/ribD-fused uncharacterized protein
LGAYAPFGLRPQQPRRPTVINSFDGEYRFLSNFYGCQLNLNGWVFSSVENAYQASKSTDPEVWKQFQNLSAPQAKRLGRKIEMRADWDQIKLDVMEELLREKFSIPSLKEKLLNTGSQELVEGNHWGDVYWGVCRGSGQNQLGKLLMKIRQEINHEIPH